MHFYISKILVHLTFFFNMPILTISIHHNAEVTCMSDTFMYRSIFKGCGFKFNIFYINKNYSFLMYSIIDDLGF